MRHGPVPTVAFGSGVGPTIVALGGGHGLSASLSALRLMSDRLTAVVTVADDGGSSGRLRTELDVLPPGDLRMALAALCDESEWGRTWRDVLQHRFRTEGSLDQHALGNLLIVALWELLGDPVSGLDWVGRLLGARGRVLPMASVPLQIEADLVGSEPAGWADGLGTADSATHGIGLSGAQVAAGKAGAGAGDGGAGDGAVAGHAPDDEGTIRVVRGQSALAVATGRVRRVRLVPDDPPACPEAVAAVEAADWVVLGPGSWFTSVMPHLLVPELSAALHRTRARRCVTLNLKPGGNRHAGMSAQDHLAALREHAPDLRADVVIADPSAVDDIGGLYERAEEMGARLLLRQLQVGDGTPRHDALRLAAAYRDAFEGFLGDVGTSSR